LTWRPGGPLYGTWRLGGWYDDASTIDGGLPGIITTIPGGNGVPDQGLGDQRGRYGVYESIVCTENLSSGVVVVKSAQDGV